VRIEGLAAGGAGVAHLAGTAGRQGEVVFVPRTAPGELVEVEVVATHKPARGRLLHVVEPSPERVTPPCPYLDACGGCDWMHLSARAQEEGHAEIVRSAVSHALRGATLPEVTVHPAPAALAYRTRARLFLQADGRSARVGYRGAASHALAAVDTCAVLDPAMDGLIADLAAVLAGARGEGDAAVARGRGGLPVVSLSFRGDLPSSTWAALDGRVTNGAWAGAQVVLVGASRPATFGDPRPVVAGADDEQMLVAPGGFAQPSDAGAALLGRRVDELSRIDPPRARHVVELFAGSGTLSVLLARGAASFAAVEVVAEAAAALRENLAARGLRGKVIAADADAFALPADTTVVVLDPPRAGAPGAARAIAASGARVVVYVSCDPSTLARDLVTLTRNRLTVTHMETFELFPQTSHIETVVRLARSPR
jgi:23S rRNA (uracil1939-C5)-methyltransferase